jgi:hypothetical protein
MPSPRSYLHEATPRGLSLLLAVLGLGFGGLTLIVALAMTISPTPGSDGASMAGAFLGIIGLPVVAILFGVAAVVDRRNLARALYLGLGAGILVIGGLLVGSSMLASMALQDGKPLNEALGTSIFSGACCGLLPALIFFVPSAACLLRGLRQVREGTTVHVFDTARALLEEKGALSFEALAEGVDLPAEKIPGLCQALAREGRMSLGIEMEHAWVCTAAHARTAMERLPGLLTARGRVTLAELSRELRAPEGVIRGWIERGLHGGTLRGTFSWKDGVLLSEDAEALRERRSCPRCGGPLELAGRGLAKCGACDAEILL